jgi:GldM N-terminal domain
MRNNFLYIIIICLAACKDPAEEKKETLTMFDRINNELQKIDTLLIRSNPLHDSLLQAAWDNSETRQMHYTINDFYGYLSNLRMLFNRFAGDSTGETFPPGKETDISLSNAFFKNGGNTSGILYGQLTAVFRALKGHTSNEVIRERINTFESNTTEKFPSSQQLLKGYFYNTPPVAVITILNNFEQTIKDITVDVLKEYFKIH